MSKAFEAWWAKMQPLPHEDEDWSRHVWQAATERAAKIAQAFKFEVQNGEAVGTATGDTLAAAIRSGTDAGEGMICQDK